MSSTSTSSAAASTSAPEAGITWDHSYARLSPIFFVHVQPTPVRDPQLIFFNESLARELGFDPNEFRREGAHWLTGGREWPGTLPLAMAYAGHQFGGFTKLGDGRAHLMGERVTPQGQRWDLHLKGSGPTPFSRRGDGRAALAPMLREVLISEALHALGVPCSRSLAVVSTGEFVDREVSKSGAVLARVASSHLRVGSFEFAAAFSAPTEAERIERTRELLDFALRRHDAQIIRMQRPALEFLRAVILRQARLIAQWMSIGFIHGVMNTDNMTISGESIDFGPCAFMDVYDPETVFSSIDHQGRYAYLNQPLIAPWNLACLAQALLPLLAEEAGVSVTQVVPEIKAEIDQFANLYRAEWLKLFRAKLGLRPSRAGEAQSGEVNLSLEREDHALIEEFLKLLHRAEADFTSSFRELSQTGQVRRLMDRQGAEFSSWQSRWQKRLLLQDPNLSEGDLFEQLRERTQQVNPAVIARNHQVEAALADAEAGNLTRFENLLIALRTPFIDGSEFAAPPSPDFSRGYQTFCGT